MGESFDLEFKLLHEEDPRCALSLFAGISIEEDLDIEIIEREVAIATRRVGHAYLVKRAGQKEIHHFEATTRYPLVDPERMLNYVTLLHVKYDLPIWTRIVILTEHGMPADPPLRFERGGGCLQRRMDVLLVKPWEMSAREGLALNRPSILPWIPLMAMTATDEKELVRRLVATGDRDLAGRTAVMAGLRYDDDEKLFRRFEEMLTEAMLKESVAYKKWSAEGREEGRRDEAQRTLKRLLTARFGNLPAAAVERIENAMPDTLELWTDRILTAKSLDEALS